MRTDRVSPVSPSAKMRVIEVFYLTASHNHYLCSGQILSLIILSTYTKIVTQARINEEKLFLGSFLHLLAY